MIQQQFKRARIPDTTETVKEKLENIILRLQEQIKLVDEQGYLTPETEPHVTQLLHKFLHRKQTRRKFILTIALCHNPGHQIMLQELKDWAITAWGLALPGNKQRGPDGNFTNYTPTTLDKMAAKSDSRIEVMKKYEMLSARLQKLSTKFGSRQPLDTNRELTRIEWGWMHTLLEAFMLRIETGKRELARATYQATGINIDQFETSKRVTCGDIAEGIAELWKLNKYTHRNRPTTASANQLQPCGKSSRICVLELELDGTELIPRIPNIQHHTSYVHIMLQNGPSEPSQYTAPTTSTRISLTSNQSTQASQHPEKKHSEAEKGKQTTAQPIGTRQVETIQYGTIYKMGQTTYKLIHPDNQEPIILNNRKYLTIGTTKKQASKHTWGQILIDLELPTVKKHARFPALEENTSHTSLQPPSLQLLRAQHKHTPVGSKKATQAPLPNNNQLTPGRIYRIDSTNRKITIKLKAPQNFTIHDQDGYMNIGTVQKGGTRFEMIHRRYETIDPHPHTNQGQGHGREDTPASNPTHTSPHLNKGHLRSGHLLGHVDLTCKPQANTDSVRNYQPNRKDATTNTDQHHIEPLIELPQHPRMKDMKQRPDAADAGNFLRRQIRSPGDFSRSNKKAFLKFEEETDRKLIHDTIISKRLRRRATSKTSITATLIKNTLLFNEDMQAGQCSRKQCQKPRICFLARRSKQEAGSLYDSWKCYKSPPHCTPPRQSHCYEPTVSASKIFYK